MRRSRSYRSYRRFAAEVTGQRRYTRSPEQLDFLNAVLAASAERAQILPAGSLLWRAQVGHRPAPRGRLPTPFAASRMKPRPGRAIEGRANPKGIPYLYLATHDETAVAEVRPWLGAYVSLARFRVLRNLRVLDCTTPGSHAIPTLSAETSEWHTGGLWGDIDRAFSRPVAASDDIAEYVPTQILAEWFRQNGFDAIAYRSSLGAGRNMALFDLGDADVVSCCLVQVRVLNLRYRAVGTGYDVKRQPAGAT